MHLRRTAIGVAALTGLAAALSGANVADAAGGGGSSARLGVYASGLNGPLGIDKLGKGFVVAEQGNGQVTVIGKRGGKSPLVKGAIGISGVAARKGKVYSVLGVPGGPEEGPPPPAGKYPYSSVLRTKVSTGRTTVLANLLSYELRHNPDGQKQFNSAHQPYDALSNPFSVTTYKRGLLVADGGANDVLRVNPRTGKVSTFFVPPTVKPSEVPACGAPDAQANPGTVGCDPVPTGVTYARGSVWVLTLGAFAPGAGRIYKLNPRNGHVQRVIKGLNAPVGLAVTKKAIYFGEPNGPGAVARIQGGKVTRATVPSPTGLVIRRGALYATSGAFGSSTSGTGRPDPRIRLPLTAARPVTDAPSLRPRGGASARAGPVAAAARPSGARAGQAGR